MIWALHRMSFSGKYKINSKTYEVVRTLFVNFLKNNHPSKKESWRIAVSESIKKTWENNIERKIESSERMKKLWESEEHKEKVKIGQEIFFNENEFWDDVDLVVTANPNLLLNSNGKTVVKYEMPYNKDIETQLTISNFKELDIILENILKHDTINR